MDERIPTEDPIELIKILEKRLKLAIEDWKAWNQEISDKLNVLKEQFIGIEADNKYLNTWCEANTDALEQLYEKEKINDGKKKTKRKRKIKSNQ